MFIRLPQDKGFNLKSPFINLASLGGAVLISRTVVAPFDRAKLLLQLQDNFSNTHKKYVSILDILSRVPKDHGVFGLWRGNLVNICRYAPTQVLNFAFKDLYKREFIEGVDMKKRFWKFLTGNLLAGGMAGVTSLFFVYPLDLARTRVTIDPGKGASLGFKSFSNYVIQIAKSEGLRGLYSGFTASVQGAFVYRSLYFGLYDTTTSLLTTSEDEKLGFVTNFIIAEVIVAAASLLVYPMDTIGRRMMVQSGHKDQLYKNYLDCVGKIIRNESVAGMYKGSFANLLRSPGGALFLALYDEIPKYFK